MTRLNAKPGDEGRPGGPWDLRDVSELSHATFKQALRGYDREEVRKILENIAADYRVLQLQNASLQRQLGSLEGVLEAYQSAGATDHGTAEAQSIRQITSESRVMLTRAHAQADETMARVIAMAGAATPPLFGEDEQKRLQGLVADAISDLLTLLNLTQQNPGTSAVVESRALVPVSPEPIATSAKPCLALVPVGKRRIAPNEPRQKSASTNDAIDTVLREIDTAMADIPITPRE